MQCIQQFDHTKDLRMTEHEHGAWSCQHTKLVKVSWIYILTFSLRCPSQYDVQFSVYGRFCFSFPFENEGYSRVMDGSER